MPRLLRNKKGQNTMEYALMVVVIIGVFSAMQLYVRRGMQARVRGATDNIPDLVLGQVDAGDQSKVTDLFGSQTQYEPYYYREGEHSMDDVTQVGKETGTITQAGGVRDLKDATSSRTGITVTTGAKEDPIK